MSARQLEKHEEITGAQSQNLSPFARCSSCCCLKKSGLLVIPLINTNNITLHHTLSLLQLRIPDDIENRRISSCTSCFLLSFPRQREKLNLQTFPVADVSVVLKISPFVFSA